MNVFRILTVLVWILYGLGVLVYAGKLYEVPTTVIYKFLLIELLMKKGINF